MAAGGNSIKRIFPDVGFQYASNWFVFLFSTVTNKKPTHVSITKVKQFQGSSAFVKRSQWTIEQLRQVNGIDPNKVGTVRPSRTVVRLCNSRRHEDI